MFPSPVKKHALMAHQYANSLRIGFPKGCPRFQSRRQNLGQLSASLVVKLLLNRPFTIIGSSERVAGAAVNVPALPQSAGGRYVSTAYGLQLSEGVMSGGWRAAKSSVALGSPGPKRQPVRPGLLPLFGKLRVKLHGVHRRHISDIWPTPRWAETRQRL